MRPLDALARDERRRLEVEHERRSRVVPADFYAAWQPSEMLLRVGRKRAASTLLRSVAALPTADSKVLEVGCGTLGWLTDLILWGVPETHLSGIDLDPNRVLSARRSLPSADLRTGDATSLPWPEQQFHLVVFSTVFSSILEPLVRQRVAAEAWRVLAPGGCVLLYDLAVRNPKNPNVKPVGPVDIGALFPDGVSQFRRVTLAPPLARFIAPRSWSLAVALEALPWLRTHLVTVVQKPVS